MSRRATGDIVNLLEHASDPDYFQIALFAGEKTATKLKTFFGPKTLVDEGVYENIPKRRLVVSFDAKRIKEQKKELAAFYDSMAPYTPDQILDQCGTSYYNLFLFAERQTREFRLFRTTLKSDAYKKSLKDYFGDAATILPDGRIALALDDKQLTQKQMEGLSLFKRYVDGLLMHEVPRAMDLPEGFLDLYLFASGATGTWDMPADWFVKMPVRDLRDTYRTEDVKEGMDKAALEKLRKPPELDYLNGLEENHIIVADDMRTQVRSLLKQGKYAASIKLISTYEWAVEFKDNPMDEVTLRGEKLALDLFRVAHDESVEDMKTRFKLMFGTVNFLVLPHIEESVADFFAARFFAAASIYGEDAAEGLRRIKKDLKDYVEHDQKVSKGTDNEAQDA
ncbi:MAG: hypothetical protein Q7S00_06405, partial [bacterium]|nr:hypothetical protein [bacterium]